MRPSVKQVASRVLSSLLIQRVKKESSLAQDNDMRFRLASKATHDAIWDWNLVTGEVIRNGGFDTLFGHKPEAVRSQPSWWLDHIHPDDRKRVSEGIQRVIDSGEKFWSDEYRFRKADGSYAVATDRGYVEHDPDGKPIKMLGAMTDITERRRFEQSLKESEAYFRSLADATPAMLWTTDPLGHNTYVSQRWLDYTGRTLTQDLRLGWLENIHPSDRERTRLIFFESVSKRVPFSIDYRVRRADGQYRWAISTGSPRFDVAGNLLGYIGAVIDVHERKQAEEALEAHAQDLARSNSELSRFAFIASHDLKEPIRVILNYTDYLEREYHDKFSDFALTCLKHTREASKRMHELVDDLLSYSRIGASADAIRDVDINDIVREAISNLQTAVNESGAEIRWHKLPTIRGVPSQLLQLFQNLIGNAVKYRRDERPEIHVESRLDDGEFLFSVRDNGIGIDPKYHERIFGLFQRLHSKDQYSGTGIGLAVCKKIVERSGGRIWVESALNKGSTFHFTVPVQD